MNENEERKNLPPLPTGEEMVERAQDEKYAEVRQYLLDARQNYPEPYYMLEYNGVPFSALGGIQAISGQKKNGKTFVLAQLMSAILADGKGRSRTHLAGLKVPDRTRQWLGHPPRVLYVDTEMEKLNTAKVLRRVHWLCGWQMDVPNDRFFCLWLREITGVKNESGKEMEAAYAKRYRLIRTAIEMIRPDAVFIDGIRDIIGDFNNNAESAALVGELMELASQKKMCIWNTLHMNPRPGNDDESKMRGHLGTELGNKVTDTMVSFKSKTPAGVTFTVKQQDARGKDLDDWQFIITEDAGALGVPRILSEGQVFTDEETQNMKEADDYFKQYPWTASGATYTDLDRWLRTKGVTSNRKMKELFDIAKEARIIYQTEKRKYHYNGLKSVNFIDTENLPFAPLGEDEKSAPPF